MRQPYSKVIHPQAIRVASAPSQIEQPQEPICLDTMNSILRELLCSDMPGSGCSTGSTHGGGLFTKTAGHLNSRMQTAQASSHRSSFSANK